MALYGGCSGKFFFNQSEYNFEDTGKPSEHHNFPRSNRYSARETESCVYNEDAPTGVSLYIYPQLNLYHREYAWVLSVDLRSQ